MLSAQQLNSVLDRMANGEILKAICAELGVSRSLVSFHACETDPAFAARYARARIAQADALADDVVLVVDDEPDPQRGKARSDARKWLASRVDPAKWGDKLGIDAKLTVSWEKLVIQAIDGSKAKTIEHEPAPVAVQQIAPPNASVSTTNGVCSAANGDNGSAK